MTPDSELLRQFARTNSEAAFAELVKRHVTLVYSTALRQVNGDVHSAKDVAQMVFTDLARKADLLARGRDASSPLTGWLYTSAHFAAAKIVRGENRRRDREEKFMREPTNESGVGFQPAKSAPETDWQKLRPTLDDAMHELKETDREAILLRYFENRQFAEVGAKLGLNENAARMRVERALEKLRGIFTKRGVTTATALASVISANAVQIAPVNLAATLTAASIVTAGTGTFTLLKIMTATKLKLGISALVVAGATTAFVIQHQAQEKLRADNEALTHRLAQFQTDDESLSNQLAAIGDSKSLTDEQMNELLKLRNEVGLLRRKNNELEKLQEESQRLRASSATAQNSQIVQSVPDTIPQDIPKDSLKFAGYATPAAALQSAYWAASKGDLKTFFASVTPETNQRIMEKLKGEGDINDSAWLKEQIVSAFGSIDNLHISNEKVDSENVAFLNYDGERKGQGTLMVKIGNEWKFSLQINQ